MRRNSTSWRFALRFPKSLETLEIFPWRLRERPKDAGGWRHGLGGDLFIYAAPLRGTGGIRRLSQSVWTSSGFWSKTRAHTMSANQGTGSMAVVCFSASLFLRLFVQFLPKESIGLGFWSASRLQSPPTRSIPTWWGHCLACLVLGVGALRAEQGFMTKRMMTMMTTAMPVMSKDTPSEPTDCKISLSLRLCHSETVRANPGYGRINWRKFIIDPKAAK